MKTLTSIVGIASCALTLLAAPAEAKGKGGGGGGKVKPAKQGKVTPSKAKPNKGGGIDKKLDKNLDKKVDKQIDKINKGGIDAKDWRKAAKFAEKDRNDIVSHWDKYKGNDMGLPPGLAKNLRRGKGLPPGWDKKVRNGWMIEDEWWSRMDRVPANYLPGDMKLPKDTGMFLFGDRMMRVHEPTREVIDFVKLPGVKL